MKRQIKNIAAGLIFGFVASASLGATAHPGLEGELGELEPGQLESLEVAKVQPTAFTDVRSTQAVGETLARVQDQDASDQVVDVTGEVASAGDSADEGFGFGGSSTKLDIVSLKYGYMLSTLPLLKGAKLAETAKTLAQLSKLNGMYSPEVARHLVALVHSAENGGVDAAALTGLMTASAQGIASAADSSGERVHGYLLAGMWMGLAQTTAVLGNSNEGFATLGGSIAQMLEKDASFGGSDRTIALQIRAVSNQLAAAKPDSGKVNAAVKAALATSADSNNG